jgi:hypothetical protein
MPDDASPAAFGRDFAVGKNIYFRIDIIVNITISTYYGIKGTSKANALLLPAMI